MTHSPHHPVRIGPDEYARRIRALLGRGGLSHALPRRERDRWIVLHAIARRFDPGERLSEPDANGRIADFLLGPGHYLELDRVTLRRALVDDGFLDRDPAGHSYRISDRHQRRVVFEEPPEAEAVLGLTP
jgi:hypothetical protein